MQTEEITFERNGVIAYIVVSEANTLMGIRRSRLSGIARKEMQDRMNIELQNREEGDSSDLVDQDEWISQCVYYPDCIAGAIKIEINGNMNTPTLAEFNALPDSLTMRWGETVYKLNPHWLPDNENEEKKKEPPTTS